MQLRKHMRRSCALATALGVVGAAGFMPAAADSLIVNGSFETATVDPGGYCAALTTGSTGITGWEVTGVEIHYCDPLYWPASDGVRTVDLDGNYDYGGVRQTFATVAGNTYTVTFDLAGNNYGPPVIKPLRVSADGQSADFQFDSSNRTYADFGWTSTTWSFVADDASATLEFLSLTPSTGEVPSYGAVIDNVVVTTVPVPGTIALFMSGLGLLIPAARRRVCLPCRFTSR